MPNLKTDRIAGMVRGFAALNVRRLMYQSLIWAVHLRDHAGRLAAALDTEHLQGAADSLIDSVRGNAELDGDLFRGEMLVDQQQGVELPLAQLGDSLGDRGIEAEGGRIIRPALAIVVCDITLHQHEPLFTVKDEIKQNRWELPAGGPVYLVPI